MALLATNVPVEPAVDPFQVPPAGVNPDYLLTLTYARVPRAIHTTAVELNAFDHFVSGSRTADEFADAAGCHPTLTRSFLDALAALDWLKRSRDRYELAPTTRFFLGSWTLRNQPEPPDPFWSRLPEMLRKGRIDRWQGYGATQAVSGRGGVDWGDPSTQRHMALAALGGGFHRTFELLTAAGVFRNARTLLDLAGGHGLFAVGFKKRMPALDVTLFDLPTVVPVAERFLEEHGLAGRIATTQGDVYSDGFAGTYDVIFVSNLGAPRAKCEALFRNAYERLNPGGVFVYKEIAPRRYWSEALYPLAHKLSISVRWGDPNGYHFWWPPTTEEARALMTQVGFSRTRFLGWVGRWATIAAGWK